jgi:hypothetical protein
MRVRRVRVYGCNRIRMPTHDNTLTQVTILVDTREFRHFGFEIMRITPTSKPLHVSSFILLLVLRPPPLHRYHTEQPESEAAVSHRD